MVGSFHAACAELREGRQPGSERVKGGYLVEVNTMWEILIFLAGVTIGAVAVFIWTAESLRPGIERTSYAVRRDDFSRSDYQSEL